MSDPEDQVEESADRKGEAETSDETEVVVVKEKEADAGSEEPEIEVEVTIESLQAQLQKASEEVEGFKDAALRAQAEMENVRRRSAKDLENAHKYGLERFVNNLLPVIDSLEKAIESGAQAEQEGANKAVIEGVGLCHKMLVDVLIKEGVVVVDPMGEPFDPNVHQAMSVVENPDVEPNSVVAVVQKGYTLNERLVRAAMVMVSKDVSPQIDEKA
ncbi:MAG TPA: nucleotide exchange factor GrpE [Pseudomonadales bacterium]|jgi:molecular chaperone GrpE|nr:nucleotide exchange factor GrpE [Gammaproteobacteria bacterium]MDP6024522.1 nucleotide exchange factor GrpE [Pseudomonadales bacterium]MDP7313300.1 nucleotide exchange factor GrpE [Pseudomonadales bacterium]HJP51791.1 nucleotide exchange factor GrpE [Pseudomonadales bacterium]|tara:strand:- start:76 stop:720 length:645 start_codon:yes stop_codon:yes gene_type:complete